VYLAKGQSSDALTYYERALELRKKANIPSQVGETLHNLGEASLKAGDYGQSLDYHLKALDLFRSSGDKSGAAIQSYSMGTIFEYQGRYGAALKSKEDDLKTSRELQDRSFWMRQLRAALRGMRCFRPNSSRRSYLWKSTTTRRL